ncbi:MAG: hypothetical protein AAF968_25390 [Pseudomonadota bacterium]
MNEKSDEDRPGAQKGAGGRKDRQRASGGERHERLGAALRANLSRRKAQARERQSTEKAEDGKKDGEHG